MGFTTQAEREYGLQMGRSLDNLDGQDGWPVHETWPLPRPFDSRISAVKSPQEAAKLAGNYAHSLLQALKTDGIKPKKLNSESDVSAWLSGKNSKRNDDKLARGDSPVVGYWDNLQAATQAFGELGGFDPDIGANKPAAGTLKNKWYELGDAFRSPSGGLIGRSMIRSRLGQLEKAGNDVWAPREKRAKMEAAKEKLAQKAKEKIDAANAARDGTAPPASDPGAGASPPTSGTDPGNISPPFTSSDPIAGPGAPNVGQPVPPGSGTPVLATSGFQLTPNMQLAAIGAVILVVIVVASSKGA